MVTIVEGKKNLIHDANLFSYEEHVPCVDSLEKSTGRNMIQNENGNVTNQILVSGGSGSLPDKSTSTSSINIAAQNRDEMYTGDPTSLIANTESDVFSGIRQNLEEAVVPCIEAKEPISEGEVVLARETIFENREPVSKGEVVLAEHGTLDEATVCSKVSFKDEFTPTQGKQCTV
ncbi:hypothetical protein QQ045_008971 [Rhodiola kirilowii]